MRFYYRLSDESYPKQKLPGTDKSMCFRNFVDVFRESFSEPNEFRLGEEEEFFKKYSLMIIADNVSKPETMKILDDAASLGAVIVKTNLGNAGSLRWAIERAIEDSQNDHDHVYFVEDDYLHKEGAVEYIHHGLQLAHYCTLYDHPDKYTEFYDDGEICKVYKTDLSHYRTTQSTCMTFATNIDTLKEDIDMWHKYTEGEHPNDCELFTELGKLKSRKLVVPIPGMAIHTDFTLSLRLNKVLIDTWGIEMATNHLKSALLALEDEGVNQMLQSFQKQGWEQLMLMEALRVSVQGFYESQI